MRQISNFTKQKVIGLFFDGLTYDEISQQCNIAKGTVVNIIDDFRDGRLLLPDGQACYVDSLRKLAVDLRKSNVGINQVKSCLALVNMYRWNSLIFAANKVLSLPEQHSSIDIYYANFAKKVRAYFYDWRSPIPFKKLAWECFRLMYIWFFIILVGLIGWGAIKLHGEESWWLGIAVFIIPTAWEVYSFVRYRAFKYTRLILEHEPEIPSFVDSRMLSPRHVEPEQKQKEIKKPEIQSQALSFFFFSCP